MSKINVLKLFCYTKILYCARTSLIVFFFCLALPKPGLTPGALPGGHGAGGEGPVRVCLGHFHSADGVPAARRTHPRHRLSGLQLRRTGNTHTVSGAWAALGRDHQTEWVEQVQLGEYLVRFKELSGKQNTVWTECKWRLILKLIRKISSVIAWREIRIWKWNQFF